ncbi:MULTISPECIES: hypothetical protein [unclassified Actinotalea]|uniref:hypothetical protein n=1 Tax=unclassified Actinotalea TaxID=2638618 RepID=UPI0015F67DAB|nr:MULTISPECIES: hypothetical protein [unclassified Actinotalea]
MPPTVPPPAAPGSTTVLARAAGAVRSAVLGAAGLAVIAIWAAGMFYVLYLITSAAAEVVSDLLGVEQPEPAHLALAVGAVVAVATVAAVVARRRAARRRREVEAWAAAHGWTVRTTTSVLGSRWATPPFSRAGSGAARHVLERTVDGVTVTSATFGRGRRTRHVAVVTLPVAFPTLSLEREVGAVRAQVAAGGADIRLESEAFNRAWRVRSAVPEFAHAVVHPRLMARLLEPDVADVGVVVEDRDVVVHRPGSTDVAAVERLASLAVELAAALPRWVRDDGRSRYETLPTTRRARLRALRSPADRAGDITP